MPGFYEKLTRALEAALLKELPRLRNAAGSEKIYAAALVTDSACVTVSLRANTLEKLGSRTASTPDTLNSRTANPLETRVSPTPDHAPTPAADHAADLPEKRLSNAENAVPTDRAGAANGSPSPTPTKWQVGEWAYSDGMDGRKSALTKVSRMLQRHDGQDHDIHAWSRDIFLEAACSAFRRAIERYPLSADPDDVTYFIALSDGSDPAVENSTAKLLNSKAVYGEFFRRGNI